VPDSFMPTASEILRVLPEIVLTVTATLIMVLTPILKQRARIVIGSIAVAGLLAAMAAAVLAARTRGRPSRPCCWWTASPPISGCW